MLRHFPNDLETDVLNIQNPILWLECIELFSEPNAYRNLIHHPSLERKSNVMHIVYKYITLDLEL